MSRTRLEAFSDGVIAIIITIMVLELKVPPHGAADAAALGPLVPTFLAYVLSFVFVGVYWNNHHHLFHAVDRISGAILWANLHLLFWLSLVPFVTGWMGENYLARVPTAAYGVVMLGAAIAFTILARAIVAHQGEGSKVKRAFGRDYKGKVSLAANAAAILLAWVSEWISVALYVAVACMWLIPDRRIERVLKE